MGFIEHHLDTCYKNPANPILLLLGIDRNKKYQDQKDHEYKVEWYAQKREAIYTAELEVIKQLVAEHLHQEEIKITKQIELEEKEEIRQQKEQERLEEKRQREEEKRLREEERVRREQEKIDAERRAEEEWIEKTKPREIPSEARFEHTHILGGSGTGKSSLITYFFLDHLQQETLDDAAVIIDPKGTLVDRLSRLYCFAPSLCKEAGDFPNRLVLIDPRKYAPALNIFAPPKRRYGSSIAEELENNAISLFQYMFSSKDSKLTDKQLTCFSYCVKLMYMIPGATILTLLELLKEPLASKVGGIRPDSPFKEHIERMDAVAQQFFFRYFYDQTEYAATKDQIASRIHGMLRYRTFQKMFLAKENKIDMFDMLQNGRIILVSCPEAVLGADGAQLFARYMVALTLQAVYERLTIPKSTWKKSYLYIDEAQSVVDEVKTQSLLQQAREFRLAVTLAHQQIKGQISEAIFSTLSANTRIKYASTGSYSDAYAMSKDMRCEPEFIMEQQKETATVYTSDWVPTGESAELGKFACFCRGVTPHPFTHIIDLTYLNKLREMDDDEFDDLIEYMKDEYGAPPQTSKPAGGGAGEAFKTPVRSLDKSEPSRPTRQTVPVPSSAKPPADPHTGAHTEPASKWGDT